MSKSAGPGVFYLPGGKPEAGEEALTTLARELREELGVMLVCSEPFFVVRDQAALERTPMEMDVRLAWVAGRIEPRAEIAHIAWVGADGRGVHRLAPAIRNHVLPQLATCGLIS